MCYQRQHWVVPAKHVSNYNINMGYQMYINIKTISTKFLVNPLPANTVKHLIFAN